MEEVRRPSDDELCGFVAPVDGVWLATVVFGSPIGRHDEREGAVEQVLTEGLSSLAERWTLHTTATGEDEVVCIVEAHPGAVTLALGYYSMPGVPTLRITADRLAAGDYRLTR